VKSNPFGALFDDHFPDPRAPEFRRHFVENLLPGLLADDLEATGPDDLMEITLQNDDAFNAGQSTSHFGHDDNDYAVHFTRGSGDFAQAIQQQLTALDSDLTPLQVVRRAMTQSCAGCHQKSTDSPNNDLGHGLTWPRSLGFVHIDAFGTLSPALHDVFLPHRKAVLEACLTDMPLCDRAAHTVTPAIVERTIGGPRHPD
jgi:hypothetical protein